MNGRMSVLDCQVWVQDVVLELTRPVYSPTG